MLTIDVNKLTIKAIYRGEEFEWGDGLLYVMEADLKWGVCTEKNQVISTWSARHLAEEEILYERALAKKLREENTRRTSRPDSEISYGPMMGPGPDAQNPFQQPCCVCGSREVEFIETVQQLHRFPDGWHRHGDENFLVCFSFCGLHKPSGAQVLLPDGTYAQLNTKDNRVYTEMNVFANGIFTDGEV